MKYYKIQSIANPEMFLIGTPAYHSYDKNGRLFDSVGKLRTFLTSVMNSEHRRKDLADWKIVEIEMIVTDVLNLTDIIKPEKMMKLLKSL